MANISLHERRKSDKRLREEVEKSDWKIYAAAAVVNAFYSSVDNAIRKLLSSILSWNNLYAINKFS